MKISMAVSRVKSIDIIPSECMLVIDRYVHCLNEKEFVNAEKAYNELMDLMSETHLDKTAIETIAQEKMNKLAKY